MDLFKPRHKYFSERGLFNMSTLGKSVKSPGHSGAHLQSQIRRKVGELQVQGQPWQLSKTLSHIIHKELQMQLNGRVLDWHA